MTENEQENPYLEKKENVVIVDENLDNGTL